MKKNENDNSNIPGFEIDSLAMVLLPAIQSFFESDEGKKEFEKWKREKARASSDKG